jgi:hypothetical protein
MSAGVVRSSGATCTITSYCSPSFLNRVTCRPPSIVSSVRPTVSTLMPMSDSLSRLILTADFGRVEAQVDLQVLHARVLAHLVEETVDDALQLGVRHLAT